MEIWMVTGYARILKLYLAVQMDGNYGRKEILKQILGMDFTQQQ